MVLELHQFTSLSESPGGLHPLGQEPVNTILQPVWEAPLHIHPVQCSLLQLLRAELGMDQRPSAQPCDQTWPLQHPKPLLALGQRRPQNWQASFGSLSSVEHKS